MNLYVKDFRFSWKDLSVSGKKNLILKTLDGRKMTAAAIAQELAHVTHEPHPSRDAVLGFAHRNGLSEQVLSRQGLAWTVPAKKSKPKRKPPRTAIECLRQLFQFADKSKVSVDRLAELSGIGRNSIWGYRRGDHSPSIQAFEEMVQVLGGKVIVEFPDDNLDEPGHKGKAA